MAMADQQPSYDFITNPAQAQKKSLLPGGGDSLQIRIIVVAAGLILLLIVGFIGMTLISSGGKSQQDALIKLTQQQAELVRISKIGIDKARDPAALNLATTTNFTLRSDQQALIVVAKTPAKQLALGKNAKTDIALTAAEQANRFDEVFTQTLQTQLTAYQKNLKIAHEGASSKKTKTVLAEQYAHATSLLTVKK